MGPGTAGERGATALPRRVWLLGASLLVAALLVPGGGGAVVAPGLLVLSVAAGVTAARADELGRAHRRLALVVPTLPAATFVVVLGWWLLTGTDPSAVALLAAVGGALVVLQWVVFGAAYGLESVRRRGRARRRFGAAAAAWKNDPTPPSYS